MEENLIQAVKNNDIELAAIYLLHTNAKNMDNNYILGLAIPLQF